MGATVSCGAGRVVVVSDSSLLLNGMLDLGDNLDAVGRFVQGEVLFDQAHLPEAELDRSERALTAIRGALGGGEGLVALLLVACGLSVGYAWYNRERREHE